MSPVRISKSVVLTPFLLLSMLGCGDETTPSDAGAEGDQDAGQETGGDQSSDAATPSNAPPAPLLDDGVVGTACSSASDCGPMGACEQELTGGSTSRLLGSQPIATPDGYCSATCNTSAECGAGGVCFGAVAPVVSGECRKACESQDDCRKGDECATLNLDVGVPVANSCQPLPPVDALGADDAGALCSTDADCAAGRCRVGLSGVGLCTGTCVSDADCGAGGLCVPGLYGSAGTCSEACESDDDCQNAAQGWGCPAEGERRTCAPKLVDGVVGNLCAAETQATDCPGGSCREEAYGTVYPEGYCIGDCAVDADCGTDGVCIDAAVCLKGCAAAAGCREGYECILHPLATITTEVTVCYPIVSEDMEGMEGTDGTDGMVDPMQEGMMEEEETPGEMTADAGTEQQVDAGTTAP